MATPTAPTISTIVTAALTDAGFKNPTSEMTATAEGRWTAQIKNDIWTIEKKLKGLMQTSIGIVTAGISRYSNPSDFASDLAITLLDGPQSYTAAGASASSITLDASDPTTDLVGREVLILSGTGAGSISQVYSYDTTTKVAAVSPSWTSTPTSGSTYLVITNYYPLRQQPAWRHDELYAPTMRQRPTAFTPIGDADHGEFVLNTAPEKAYGMRTRYFANLMTLDTASTTLTTFIQKFEHVFYKGYFAKALRRKDDDRWTSAESDYRATLKAAVNGEKYGTDISDMQARVCDFR